MKDKIIDALISIGSVKFGEFTLKSGIASPVYIDLRIVVSYPRLLRDIGQAFIQLTKGLKYDRIAGIPYTGLPLATAFSLASEIPMIFSRREKKTYGTRRQIEGVWRPGELALIIDDLITNGDSKVEVISIFRQAGLEVKDAAVLIDREQGGKERLRKDGFELHSLISVFDILNRMRDLSRISESRYAEVHDFLLNN